MKPIKSKPIKIKQKNTAYGGTNSSTSILNNGGHNSLKSSHNSIQNINSVSIRQPRRLSIDNSSILLNNQKLNNPLYSSSINNSNISLQSFYNTGNGSNLSRHSSINEIVNLAPNGTHPGACHGPPHLFKHHTLPQGYQLAHHATLNMHHKANATSSLIKTNSTASSLGFSNNHFLHHNSSHAWVCWFWVIAFLNHLWKTWVWKQNIFSKISGQESFIEPTILS